METASEEVYDQLIALFSKTKLDSAERDQEITFIDEFIVSNAKLYQFDQRARHLFVGLFKNRLSAQDLSKIGTPVYLLKLLQMARLLTRDNKVMSEEGHYIAKCIPSFANLLAVYAKQRYSEDVLLITENDAEISIVIEALCIIKHGLRYLASKGSIQALEPLFKSSETLFPFFHSRNNHLILFLLDFFTIILDETRDDENLKQAISQTFVDPHYLGLLTNQLAFNERNKEIIIIVSSLLQKLIKANKKILFTLKKIQGNELLISIVNQTQNHDIRLAILNLISKIVSSADQILLYKSLGFIPILLAQITQTKYITEFLTILELMSLITVDDEASVYIYKKASTLFLRMLSVLHPKSSTPYIKTFEDLDLFEESTVLTILQLSLFRLLRFLFCIEKNRKMCKMIFPPRLLGIFIDIGNYKHEIQAYENVVTEFNKLTEKDFKGFGENIEKFSEMAKATAGQTGKLGTYEVLEQIGKGAFGVVHLCRLGEARYAIKEIPIKDIPQRSIEKQPPQPVKGSTVKPEMLSNLEDYFREVRIYKDLDHQNIIKYYDSFVDKENLCIVMEFVDGFSLSEFIKIQSEKNVKIPEATIWKIIISLCSVLRYLHVEKRIVHRDLNPSNIMITHLNEIKLADFGLAKKLSHSYSLMNSLVGTLIYSCPEIVQNQPYSEKADIWAFGCIVYELIALKPAFSSNNPLTLAKKIVDMDFEKLTSTPYSRKLLDFVDLCMMFEVQKRPSVLEVIQFISDEILSHADQTKREMIKVTENLSKTLRRMPGVFSDGEPILLQSPSTFEGSKIKIGVENLTPIKTDPFIPVFEVLFKLMNVMNQPYNIDNDEEKKRYIIDEFFRRLAKTPMTPDQLAHVKKELFAITNFSREEMTFLTRSSAKPDHGPAANEDGNEPTCRTYEDFHLILLDLYKHYTTPPAGSESPTPARSTAK